MFNLILISFSNIIIPAGILVAVGVLFACLLAYLGKKLSISRDERIDQILGKLSGANCGGCGYAGCDAFATALAEGKAKIDDCPSTAKENKQQIAEILGVSCDGEETVCVINCIGGLNCKDKFDYLGYGDCGSCELLAGGRKQCSVGCMGMGSCVSACPHDAVKIVEGRAIIDKEKCVSCGICMKECPKSLISRVPKKAKVYVGCSTKCKGKEVKGFCQNGCISCGLCSKVCESGAIILIDNIPQIDYKKCTGCLKCMIKCPVKCIKKL